MKKFKAGDKVRFNVPGGGLAIISDYKRSWDWKVPGYLGEGFWQIKTVPDQRDMIALETDLVLGWDGA